jgi:hypothetical protein
LDKHPAVTIPPEIAVFFPLLVMVSNSLPQPLLAPGDPVINDSFGLFGSVTKETNPRLLGCSLGIGEPWLSERHAFPAFDQVLSNNTTKLGERNPVPIILIEPGQFLRPLVLSYQVPLQPFQLIIREVRSLDPREL